MIDIIGDIHGHADTLETLLQKLGYEKKNDVYQHLLRKVLFVGDYIDRGPKIPETLAIVKGMVDAGHAKALMGNHEYNAICFHMNNEKRGGHLRPHTIKNVKQHYETLAQFQNKQKEYNAYIEWFKTLPLYYETEHFRAVHACWDNEHIEYLRNALDNNRITNDLLQYAEQDAKKVKKIDPNRLYTTLDATLKGKEMAMPEGQSFLDKDGHRRTDIRIKWWLNPAETNYKEYSVIPLKNLPETSIENPSSVYYLPYEKPVFFGHYWLKGEPVLYRDNVCCLDYSVAKGGHLVAYRYDNEAKLDNSKFVWV